MAAPAPGVHDLDHSVDSPEDTTCPLPFPYDTLPAPARPPSRALRAREALFRQGDRARGPWFVHTGELALERHEPGGRRLLLHRARAGSVIAEASLFADRYHCDAIARRDAEVTLLEREALLERFGTDADFARALAESFAREIQRLRRRIELVGIPGAEARVLEAVRDGLLADTDVRGLADLIGLSAEATSRALGALARRGVLVQEGRGRYRLEQAVKGSARTSSR